MKVIINNAEMVPTPKKGTIIRFGDCGLFVIGIYVGRSDDNGYMVVVLQHNATPPGTLKTYKELSRWSRLEESITPVKYEDIWNNSDEEPEDYEWIPETEIEDVYGIDFMESLPNIDDGEMVEIRIKCTAEKCE
jgi:hypothetical protein